MREILYGRNVVYESLRAKRRALFSLQVLESVKPSPRIDQILQLAAADRVPVSRVPRLKLDDPEVNHQGVALEAGPYPYIDLTDILDRAHEAGEPPFILILDALQDPQNFGALLRTAEIVGVHGAIIPLARTVQVTPAVVGASAGASEYLYIAPSNLAQAVDALKEAEVWVVGLDARGQVLGPNTDRHLRGALALVVGS